MKRDYYDVLGVDRAADDTAIKKAFRRLARDAHPDANPDDPEAEERFKELAEAYEVLSDGQKRQLYDRHGHDGLKSGGYQPPTDFGSLSDLLGSIFGGAAGGGGFGDIFGGGRAGGPAQGADVGVQIDVDLAEAATGLSEEITYEVVATCEHCKGNAAEPGTPISTCQTCGGAGQVQQVQRTPFGQMVRSGVCPTCEGQGKVPETPCRVCSGRGRVADERAVAVDVPAGIADGQRIRVTGRGHAGERGGPPGDLFVLVHVREDSRFVRDGDDLVTALSVPAPLAALGASLPVPTLDGDQELEIPAGTQPGKVLTVRGAGMPSLRSGRRGDLRVMVDVSVPRKLDKHQRRLMQELADSIGDDAYRDDESVLGKLRRLARHL